MLNTSTKFGEKLQMQQKKRSHISWDYIMNENFYTPKKMHIQKNENNQKSTVQTFNILIEYK